MGRFNARQGFPTPQERDPVPLPSTGSRGSRHPLLHCACGAGRVSGPLPDPLPLDTQVSLKIWQQNKPSASSRTVPEGPNEDSGPAASSFSSPRPFHDLVFTSVSNHNYWLWWGSGNLNFMHPVYKLLLKMFSQKLFSRVSPSQSSLSTFPSPVDTVSHIS